jgi:predicted RNA binding protein YcfA (HicA-like mRNA interferase family)
MSDYERVKPAELLRRLRRRATRRGVEHTERPARGGHVLVRHGGRTTVVGAHPGDIPTGTFHKILKDLSLRPVDLED